MVGYSGDIPEFPRWLPEDGNDFLSKRLKTGVKERWTVKELLNHPFVKIWWWVRKRQTRYVSEEARHGRGFVETQSTVISNVGKGRAQNTELVTEMD
ncbi:hypothetical protein L1887_39826 [Cichorium endivia]|nr:hypothetical protein L1887_39826 [Cichorium endivia]